MKNWGSDGAMGCRGQSGDLSIGLSDSKAVLFILLLSHTPLKRLGCGSSPHLWGFAWVARSAWKALCPLLQLIPFPCWRLSSSLPSSGKPFLLPTPVHPRHLGSCPWTEWLMPLSDYWSSLGDGCLWDGLCVCRSESLVSSTVLLRVVHSLSAQPPLALRCSWCQPQWASLANHSPARKIWCLLEMASGRAWITRILVGTRLLEMLGHGGARVSLAAKGAL